MREPSFIKVIKGFFIGIALVIPGLSGSFFSVVVGLYEPIVEAVVQLRKSFQESVVFLLPIILGCVLGILLSAKGLLWVCTAYPSQSYIFFIGLVLGSFPVVIKKTKGQPFHWAYGFILCISFVLIVQMAGAEVENHASGIITRLDSFGSAALLFWAGLFSCSFMMIPGVSGSILLMVTGQYETVYGAVGSGLDLLTGIAGGNFQALPAAWANLLVLTPFVLGAALGILLIARCINFFLHRFETAVYYGVTGMAAGSVYILWQMAWTGSSAPMAVLGAVNWLHIVLLLLGAACTYFLDLPKE